MKPWRKFGPEVYGDVSTGYLLVGEAPGYVSWRKRRRFTGPAGMLIRRALWSVGHPRYRHLEDLFYMTDVVKCHPAAPANPSSNRSPRRIEVEACADFLVREIRVLQPSVIVAFGKAAAENVRLAVSRAMEASGASCSLKGLLQPDIMTFPHPSPRNQATILKHYRSMRTFEDAIARTFHQLIVRLEASKGCEV